MKIDPIFLVQRASSTANGNEPRYIPGAFMQQQNYHDEGCNHGDRFANKLANLTGKTMPELNIFYMTSAWDRRNVFLHLAPCFCIQEGLDQDSFFEAINNFICGSKGDKFLKPFHHSGNTPVYYDRLSKKVLDVYSNDKQPLFIIAEEEKIFATTMAKKIFAFCEQNEKQRPRIYYFRGALGLNGDVVKHIHVQDHEEIISILDFKMRINSDTYTVSRLHANNSNVFGIVFEDLVLSLDED